VVGSREELQIVRIRENNTPNDVLQYLLQHGVSIHSFNEILPSLNDIFIRLVEGTPAARQFQKIN
jgi:ABC-2 type transport system ATP-binding protein